MSYDFSHCSPQDTKTAMRLVQKIDEITRDKDLCLSESSKNILSAHLNIYNNLLNLYKDPEVYNSIQSLGRSSTDDVTIR